MTTIQDRIISKFTIQFSSVIKNISVGQYDENGVNIGFIKAKDLIKQFLIQSIKLVEEETRKETLDLIAEDQGWEESRDIYANALGLPLKYPKLMESYKKRNHIKGKIILDCQNLSITNKEKL